MLIGQSGSQVCFFGSEITAHFKNGEIMKFGCGLTIANGDIFHVLAGQKSKRDGNPHLTVDSVTEIKIYRIKNFTYRNDAGHIRTFEPNQKASP